MALTKITNDGVDFSGTTDINIDSGTFVVDASTDRVGVGTTSPLDTLHVNQSASGDILRLNTTSGSGQGILLGVDTSGGFTYWKNNTSSSYDMRFEVGGGEKLRIDSSGNVGIGTSSPQRELHVQGSTNSTIRLQAANTATSQLLFSDSDAEIRGRVGYYHPDDALDFYSAGNERMRIDSSGRLLVGTSSNIFSQKFQIATTDGQAAEFSRFNTNGGGPELNFISSRNATIGSHTIKQSDDSLGRIWFRGSDGSNYRAAAAIGADVDGTPGTDDMPGRLRFYTTADGASSPTERMRIDSTGHVTLLNNTATVGTGSSSGQLQIYGGASLRGGEIDLYGGNNGGVILFRTGTGSGQSSERVRIDGSGRLLLGTTTEGHPNADDFTIAGSGNAGITIRSGSTSTGAIFFSDATTGSGEYDGYIEYNQNTREYNFGSAATDAMRIDASQNLKFNSGYGSVATAYGCRAWVNFNGKNTVSIRDSGNVSSITDNGTGDYTVNFSNSMPDDDFCVVGSASVDSGGYKRIWTIKESVLATNLVRGQTGHSYVSNLENEDCQIVTVAVFR